MLKAINRMYEMTRVQQHFNDFYTLINDFGRLLTRRNSKSAVDMAKKNGRNSESQRNSNSVWATTERIIIF